MTPGKCNSIVLFTTNWKFWCWMSTTCLHSHISIYSNLTLIPNIQITFLLTQCSIHGYKTGNDVSEFIHSNWITLSYYSSPKHKSLILNIQYICFTSVHSNSEHGLAILTESFSPLRSVLHNLPCWSPKQKSTSIDTQYNSMTSVALQNII